MTWVTVGAAAIGAGASIYGSNKAAGAMQGASRGANQVAQQTYNQQRADLDPYRRTGTAANNALARAMGLPESSYAEPTYGQYSQIGKATEYDVVRAFQEFRGRAPTKKERKYYSKRQRANQLYDDVVAPGIKEIESRQAAEQAARPPQTAEEAEAARYGDFYESPGYQFRYDEGARAVDRNAASRGLYGSGQRAKALTRYGQGVASDEFGNYVNRLSGIASSGQNAATNSATAAGQYAGNAGSAINQAGMARASGYLGASGAISSGINNVLAAAPYWNTTGSRRGGGTSVRAGSDDAINWAIRNGGRP